MQASKASQPGGLKWSKNQFTVPNHCQWTPSSRDPLASQIFTVRSLRATQINSHQWRNISTPNQNKNHFTYSEAVNRWLLLVARPLMGLSWPWMSPRGASESAWHRRRSPPRHPPSSADEPGTAHKALTQSAWKATDCSRKDTRAPVQSQKLPTSWNGSRLTCSSRLLAKSHFLTEESLEPL